MTVDPFVRRAAELFVAEVGAKPTPGILAAVMAWAYLEGGNEVHYNNPWNLHGRRGDYGGLAIGDWYAGAGDVHVAKFGSLADGVKAAVLNLRAHGSDFAHYDRVLAAAKTSDGPAFLDALARSAWSAGRYGGSDNNHLVPLYRQILPTVPAPQPPPSVPEEPPVKPSVLRTEPLLALGVVGSIISAIIVGLVDGKTMTADQGNLLVQLAAVAVPLILTAIGRQFVTPNVKVPDVATPATPKVANPYPTNDPAILAELQKIADRGAADGTPPTPQDVWETWLRDKAERDREAREKAAAQAAAAAAPKPVLVEQPQAVTTVPGGFGEDVSRGRFAPTPDQLAEIAKTGHLPIGLSWGTPTGGYLVGSVAPTRSVDLSGPSPRLEEFTQQLWAIEAGQKVPNPAIWPSEAINADWRHQQLVQLTASILTSPSDGWYGDLTADQVKQAANFGSPFGFGAAGNPVEITSLYNAANAVSRDPSVLKAAA